jgi:uncharacterized membrane protein HdeD (DUF308 family)
MKGGSKLSNKSIKTMLLGIMIILFGGFILLDPASSLGGIEFFIIVIGLIIGFFGMIQKD